MFYFVSGVFLLLILLWAAMIWLRKSLWDVVHRNLLDMEDSYDGKVIRDGFAARPVFHGTVNGKDITINFSSARSENKRQNYIDFTLSADISATLTIAESHWLKSQNNGGSVPDSLAIETSNGFVYHVMPAGKPICKKLAADERFINLLTEFDRLAYFFVGKTGAICEFVSDALDKDTEFTVMEKRLSQIDALLNLIDGA